MGRFPDWAQHRAVLAYIRLRSGEDWQRELVRTGARLRLHLHVILWCVLLLLAPGCRTASAWHVSDPTPAIARLRSGGSVKAETDLLVEPVLAKGEAYGMAVGVVEPSGATEAFGYGHTGNSGDPLPPGPDAVFQIGSVSKLFVEVLLARMVQEGQMSYTDTVRSILPPQVQVSDDIGRLTVYELATHTSGLPREPFGLRQFLSLARYLVTGRNLYAHLTRPHMLAYLRKAHINRKRRGKFAYSNIGIGLLGELLEAKIGQSVTNLIEETISRPLHMHDSVFVLDADQQRRLTVGHVGNQACWKLRHSRMAPWDMGDWMRASAGMYSTLDDLLLFAKANLGLSPSPLASAMAATHRVQIQSRQGGEAFGWVFQEFDNGRENVTFKGGVLSGYCAYIGLNLQRHVGVVVLCNSFNWDDWVGHNLLLRLSGAYAQDPDVALQR